MVTIYLVAHTCDTTNNVQKLNYTHDVILSQLVLIVPSTELLYSSQILTQDIIVSPIFVLCKTLNPFTPRLRSHFLCFMQCSQ